MTRFFLLLFVLTLPIHVFSRSESEAGPHGGYIKMPGAFHVELVPISKERLQFYLLDMDFKNPTIEKSSVQVRWRRNGQAKSLLCYSKKINFECVLPKELGLKKFVEIEVLSTRNETTGAFVKYPFPFRHSFNEALDEEDSEN